MLTVHHLGISQSERIVWLCEELELDYTFKRYDRRADNRLAPDEYKALHPAGMAPVVEDDGMVLAESGAICEYIDRKYGGGKHSPGPEHPDFAQHLFWFHYANGTFMTNGMMQLMLAMAEPQNPMPAGFVADRTAKAWAQVEERLGEAEFLGGGQLTLADIMMVYCLTTARMFRESTLDGLPNTAAYLQRIAARPAYQRAWAKCEPGVAPNLT
ncbi:glutathione S-transferase family protein [Altererythrobacter sp. H2]|uniref:glutathione S-transferase family protein n=1 Tax=Altererythrobacter sp. H2 TaxID=3108391 RepID=UPI002B4C1B11|nr:glutathione S-transferase family protein [Altererythrobacter sp. H2]WRK94717.1 glutathione S-transferase family protein [Altererythrobacter sp. H2]